MPMPKKPFSRAHRSSLRLVRNEEAPNEATIYIYDVIDSFWGINAADVVKELNALTVETINVRINSPGGDVFDGVSITNALRQHKARVVVHIDGLAASIASVIAMAGDEIRMAEDAFFMIHDPWTFAFGNARDLRKTAELLDKIGNSIVKDYLKRVSDEDQVREWMAQETWFEAEEAKDAGFVDIIVGAEEDEQDEAEAPAALYDLSVFKHAPAALATRDVKSKKPTVREMEQALRNAGCESAEAKRIVALGLKNTEQGTRDEDPAFVAAGDRLLKLMSTHS